MEIVKFDIETAVITALEAKYANVKITDGKSYKVVMDGLREYRGLRLKIDAKHKELKKDALEYGRAADAEKNRLKGLLEPGEQHLKDIRKAEDDRKAAIKAEKERKEQERIDGIQENISSMEQVIALSIDMDANGVAEAYQKLKKTEITNEEYQEFTEKAIEVQKAVLTRLNDIFLKKVKEEEEAVERKVEAERLEKQRKEQEEAQRKIDEEKAKLEAAKKAEQDRKEREEFERKAKEEAKAQAEREAKEKVEKEEKEKAEAEAERVRQEALKPDKEKLISFTDQLFTMEGPPVVDKKAKKILLDALAKIRVIGSEVIEKANTL